MTRGQGPTHSSQMCGDHAAHNGGSATLRPIMEMSRNMETETVVGFERNDGSTGRIFVGMCDSPERYASAVRLAVEEARRDGGHHIVVRIKEVGSGRILSSVYAREGRLL